MFNTDVFIIFFQEGFFLVLGTILFLIVGGVSITSVDDMPPKLVDNGIILGILTIVTAILFLLDIGFLKKQPGQTDSKTTKPLKIQQQKELPKLPEAKPTQVEKVEEGDKKKRNVFQELKSSLKRRSHDGEANHRNSTNDVRTVEFQEREIQDGQRQKRSNDTTSPQVGRRNMENRGFTRGYHRDVDGQSPRTEIDPDEFRKSFSKVEKVPNGYINNEDRQTAFSLKDDERYYSKDGGDFRRHEDRFDSSRKSGEYYSERRPENHNRQPNGYIRKDGIVSEREDFYRPNGHARHIDEVDSRTRSERDDPYRSSGFVKRDEEPESERMQRRHSIDYVDKDERNKYAIRSDDYLRRSKEYEKRRTMSVEGSPRYYRKSPEDVYRKSEERTQFDELRKPEYVEDRRSYKGYTDTVKYLEQTSSERQRMHDDDDSAMPPKHVIEVELDDHFYRPVEPKSKRNDRKLEERDTLQVAKVTSSQRSENNNSSDDSELTPQIPSVSFLLSERGRKMMPSLTASPIERLERVSSSTPKYYFADPSSPGYVKQTASHWPSPSPVPPKEQSSRSSP